MDFRDYSNILLKKYAENRNRVMTTPFPGDEDPCPGFKVSIMSVDQTQQGQTRTQTQTQTQTSESSKSPATAESTSESIPVASLLSPMSAERTKEFLEQLLEHEQDEERREGIQWRITPTRWFGPPEWTLWMGYEHTRMAARELYRYILPNSTIPIEQIPRHHWILME